MAALQGRIRPISKQVGIHTEFETELEENQSLAAERWLKEVDLNGNVVNTANYIQVKILSDIIGGEISKTLLDQQFVKTINEQPIIALFISPSILRISSIFAIWKLGAAFLPIDQQMPPLRINTILKQSKAICLITDGNEGAQLIGKVLF